MRTPAYGWAGTHRIPRTSERRSPERTEQLGAGGVESCVPREGYAQWIQSLSHYVSQC